MAERNMKMKKRVIKEGILHKKTSLLKQWRPRFVVLNRQMLCTFKKEDDQKRGRTAEARIFLMDIESIEKCESKKRKHCFNLIVEGKPFFSFSCSSELDREMWMRSVQIAKENELNEEENDPIRRKSTKLTGGLKRITIQREKGQGLGCTIKNVGGVILVNRILEDGPVSTSGILRPGDQILDINGIEVGGRTVSEISEIIKGSPELVVCTVKPFSDYRYCDTHSTGHTEYAEIDLDSLKAKGNDNSSNSSQDGGSDSPRESNDQKIHSDEVKKRHSLPTVLPDIHSAKDFHKGDTVNYLELNFPQNDRPRGRSDASRSPQVPHRAGRERNKPAAYIELEFNKKENKFQEVGKESSDAKAGDRKSSSLPRS